MTISNWQPNYTVSPATGTNLDPYLTTPFAGGSAVTPPTPPTPPPGMLLWLAQGTAVVSGATVNWPDSSGNGYNGVGNNALSLSTISGKQYVGGFLASNGHIQIPAGFTLNEVTGYEVYAVVRVASSTNNVVFACVGSNSDLFVDLFCFSSVQGGNSGLQTGTLVSNATALVSAPSLNTTILVDGALNGLVVTFKQTGFSEVSAAYITPAGRGVVGASIGSAGTGSPFDGFIAEVLVYPAAQDKTAVRAYLNTEYGLS